MKYFKEFFDFSYLSGINCRKENPEFSKVQINWNSYLQTNNGIQMFDKLYYPLTNNKEFKFNIFSSHKLFADKVYKNIKIISNFSNDNNYHKKIENQSEVILVKDQKNGKSKIEFNLKRKNFSSFNKNTKDNVTTDYYNKNNILFIYLDSVSRVQFIQKFVFLRNFLESFSKGEDKNKNENSPLNNYQSIQFFKYHSINDDNYPKLSTQSMFYGINYLSNNESQIKPPFPHILTHLKKTGYITAQSANICSKEFLAYQKNKEFNYFNRIKNIEEYDYENIAMFCDPYYFIYNDFHRYNNKDVINNVKYINSKLKRCLYGKNTLEYVLEYGKLFWKLYPDQKKFLRLGFFDGDEGSLQVIRYLDIYLTNFLKELLNENLLENTLVFIVSDQGNMYSSIFNKEVFNDFDIERYLGSWFMLVDKKKLREEDLLNILNNQQNFVTAYDIYDTLLYYAYGNCEQVYTNKEENEELYKKYKSLYGQSVFSYISSYDRKCNNYIEISKNMCRCKNY